MAEPRLDRARSRAWLVVPVFLVAACALFALQLGGAEPAAAQENDDTEPTAATEPTAEELAAEEQLREGSAAYSQICASCHQAGGIGVTGQFPPLRDNPRADDAEYVRTVITSGRSGELEVDGVVYDGVMPSFSTLPDDDIEAIIAFIGNDFVAPAAEVAAVRTGPVAGTELPALTNMGTLLAFVIVAGSTLLVLGPRITSVNDRLNFPWLDAWLRTAVIVAAVILFTVVIPDWAVRNATVGSLSRFAQDAIGVGLWGGGVLVVLWGLWYAHRESRL